MFSLCSALVEVSVPVTRCHCSCSLRLSCVLKFGVEFFALPFKEGGEDCRFSNSLLATSPSHRCLGNTDPSSQVFSASHGARGLELLYVSLLLHMHPGGRKQIFPIKTNHCTLIHPSFRSSRCSWAAAGSAPAGWILSRMLNPTVEPGVPWDF